MRPYGLDVELAQVEEYKRRVQRSSIVLVVQRYACVHHEDVLQSKPWAKLMFRFSTGGIHPVRTRSKDMRSPSPFLLHPSKLLDHMYAMRLDLLRPHQRPRTYDNHRHPHRYLLHHSLPLLHHQLPHLLLHQFWTSLAIRPNPKLALRLNDHDQYRWSAYRRSDEFNRVPKRVAVLNHLPQFPLHLRQGFTLPAHRRSGHPS